MKPLRRATRWPGFLGVLLAAACSGAGGAPDETQGGGAFLAFANDFSGYHSWEAFDVTEGAAATGIHDGSTLTAYLSHRPESGSEAFPVGTMIVKEPTGGTEPPHIFAMAKRGAGYNANVPGWEWFELENLGDGSDGVRLVWRGVGPPAGEMYGGDPNAGCNTCHSACPDGVCSPPLAISGF